MILESLHLIPLLAFEAILIAGGGVLVYRLLLANRIFRSKRHLESAFDSIEDPLAIVDKDYTLVRVNKAYSDLVRQPFLSILGCKCYATLRNRTTPCDDCQMEDVIETEKKRFTPTSEHPRAPERRTISITFYPFRSRHAHKEVSVVEHIRDITELEFLKSRLVQRSTLPQKAPEMDGLKIDLTYHPIEAVGGDVYDFIAFNEHRLAVFVGDASGHGLPSAFVSTISKMALYNNTREEITPARLLDRINVDLLGNIRTTHYLTSVCAVFDTSENSITYARAGHPMPIIIRANGQVFHLGANGTFVGILENAIYEQRKFFLRKGDRCYLCTDGIYEVMEAKEPAPDILGFKRFSEIVASVNHLPFEKVIPAIRKKLAKYTYEDDYTLIVIEITHDRPVDLAEALPGFDFDDDIAYVSFTDYPEISKQFDAVLNSMAKKGYGAEDLQRVRLCVNELVANALEHGNAHNRALPVVMAYTVGDTAVKLCVVDQGQGFDIGALADPTLDENINREGGRGLYLVKQFVDHVGQNTKGNGVFVIKNKGRAS